ncbi:MAG: hypothetical protein NT136_02600 [Candidatus Moranbacteria bacterium]|nr:hypothetical protein [Candidatus Moranbacteria bacterium]
METRTGQLFKSIKELDPPSELQSTILREIKFEKAKIIKRKRAFFYSGILASLFLAVFAGLHFVDNLSQSGFWNLAKLAFSDTRTIAVFWKDFALSLLETFPVAYAIGTLIPFLTLVLFLNFYLKLNGHNHNNHYNIA